MKKIIPFIIMLFGLMVAHSQNPYASLGKDTKVLTLSNGKYNELISNDTIVPIGDVLLNTITGEVVAFIEQDIIHSEYSLKPEVVSRWLSPDPLAHQFSEWSPYNYVYDNPLIYTDPDGRAPAAPLDNYYDENGNFLYEDNQTTDNIRIISSDDWSLIKFDYSEELADNTKSEKGLMTALESKSIIVNEANISAKAWSNITTQILNNTEGVDVSQLKDGKVAVYDAITGDKEGTPVTGQRDLANTKRSADGAIITVYLYGGSADTELRTVSNVENSLGGHEYEGHWIKKHGDRTHDHSRAYEIQFNHPSWDNTTEDFQKAHKERYKNYKDANN